MAACEYLPPITYIGIVLVTSKFSISLLLKMILYRALKSFSRRRIALSSWMFLLSIAFSSITNTHLIHHISSYPLFIARFTSFYLISTISIILVCTLQCSKCSPKYDAYVYSFSSFQYSTNCSIVIYDRTSCGCDP